MPWYYLNDTGEVVGPVSEQTLKELRNVGALKGETQVCRECTEVWINLTEAFGIDGGGDSFKFNCPHCGQQISAGISDAGIATQCPSCDGEVVVPGEVSKSQFAAGPASLPWVISLASDPGVWSLVVSFPNLDDESFAQILALAVAYGKCDAPNLVRFRSHDPARRTLLFDLGTGEQPVHLFKNSPSSEKSDRIRATTDLMIKCAAELHARQLGIWYLDEDSVWMCGNEVLLIPSFWIPALSAEERDQACRVPPELRGRPISSSSAVAADIFAISQAIFRLLAGKHPCVPGPQLDILRELGKEEWESFLDAGLRVRPERRPQTLKELGQLVPSSHQSPPGLGVQSPSPFARHVRSGRTTGNSAPNHTSKKKRNNEGRGRRALLIFGAGIALIVGLMIVKATLFKNGAAGLISSGNSSSGYTRGFGDTILQYPDRSYESSSWSEVYSDKRLLPADAEFDSIAGWDGNAFAIFGKIGNETLILHYHDNSWTWKSYERYAARSYSHRVKDARFVDPEKFVAVFPGNRNGSPCLVEVTRTSITELSDDADCNHLAVISEDTFFGADSFDNRSWLLRSGKMSTPEEKQKNRFIINDDNTIAQGEDDHELETCFVFSSGGSDSGKAIGLFSADFGGCGIAEYRNGRWHLLSLTPELRKKGKPRPWFDKKGNVTAGGTKSIVRFAGGKLSLESISVSGQEIPAESIAAIWGHDLDHFWTVDRRGNVYGRSGSNWKIVVRGPPLEEEEVFIDVWPTPEGDLIAITEEKVFRLE